ncbi:MAG: hypothetical protein R6V26_09710 [Roseovarius sp.]
MSSECRANARSKAKRQKDLDRGDVAMFALNDDSGDVAVEDALLA